MVRQGKRIPAGVVAAAATLFLHSVFVVMALLDSGVPAKFPDLPDAVGTGANSGNPNGESLERRIVVRIISDISANPEPATMDAFLEHALKAPARIDVTGPDTVPMPPLIVAEDGVAAESSDAELIAREKMVGIYQSQIRARVERAWELPTDLSAADGFSCRALIRQHRDGRVKDVELPYGTCAGTPEMLQSVVNAIFTASPLPAPPHPDVFVDSFSLLLHAESARKN